MPDFKKLFFLFAAASFLLCIASYEIGFKRWPPSFRTPDGTLVRHNASEAQMCAKSRMLSVFGDQGAIYYWSICNEQLRAYRSLDSFNSRYFAVVGAGGAGVIALFGFAFAVRLERPRAKVIRGRHYLKGRRAMQRLRQANRRECRQSGSGIVFPPCTQVSRERETRHWLIWGSVGAGKTQSMLHLILGAIDRGDKVLILDTKGDMTATLTNDPVLVAPQDSRSLIWDVASDCKTKQDARELAARLIPASSDPMWSDAAREVFVACVTYLQSSKGANWSWRDLRDVAVKDAKALYAIAASYHAEAMRVLQDPLSKTTQSVLATFQAHMNVVSTLADAWADHKAPKFSVTDWLHMTEPARPIILQRDSKYPELSNAWIGGLLGLLASNVGSPSLSESRTRRIWLFIDEFPQLPRLDHFSTFLDVGRSKGVIVVLGAQDISQIRAIYGRERADSWIGMIGTHIITRINLGRGAEEASMMIGDQEIEKRNKSISTVGARSTVTESTHREFRRAITPSEISSRLGPRKKGVRVLMLGPGEHAYEIDLPYIKLAKLRDPTLPAEWTYKSPPTQAAAQSNTPPPTQYSLSDDVAERIRRLGR